jgi:hypothetical protein
MINMNEKLYEIVGTYEREDGSLSEFRDDDDTHIVTAVREAFEEAGFAPCEYSVISSTVFSCPSADFGYVSITWLEDGKLYHQTYEYE